MSSDCSFEAAYRALALKAWHTNSGRVSELQQLVDESYRTGTWTREGRERAKGLAHSIRGSAGTFGHDTVSIVAEALENRLQSSAPEPPLGEVAVLISRMAEEIARTPG